MVHSNAVTHRIFFPVFVIAASGVGFWAGGWTESRRVQQAPSGPTPETAAGDRSPCPVCAEASAAALLDDSSSRSTVPADPTAAMCALAAPVPQPTAKPPASAAAFANVENCLASAVLNPSGKVLDDLGREQLQALLVSLTSQRVALDGEVREHHEDLIRLKLDTGDWTRVDGTPSPIPPTAYSVTVRMERDGIKKRIVVARGEYAPLDEVLDRQSAFLAQQASVVSQLIASL